MFWFKGWYSEQPPVNRTNPWTKEQVSGESPDHEKSGLSRTFRLPLFWAICQLVPPALAAAIVVVAGYWTGKLCSFHLCSTLVGLTWVPAVILLMVEACRFSGVGWFGRLFRICFLAYAFFLLIAESSMIFFSWYDGHFWLTRVVPLLVPLLVGGMVLHRQKRWIGAAGAWLLLFSSLALVTFNAVNEWEFVGFFTGTRIRF